jgi:hypothetical protein
MNSIIIKTILGYSWFKKMFSYLSRYLFATTGYVYDDDVHI